MKEALGRPSVLGNQQVAPRQKEGVQHVGKKVSFLRKAVRMVLYGALGCVVLGGSVITYSLIDDALARARLKHPSGAAPDTGAADVGAQSESEDPNVGDDGDDDTDDDFAQRTAAENAARERELSELSAAQKKVWEGINAGTVPSPVGLDGCTALPAAGKQCDLPLPGGVKH